MAWRLFCAQRRLPVAARDMAAVTARPSNRMKRPRRGMLTFQMHTVVLLDLCVTCSLLEHVRSAIPSSAFSAARS